LIIGVKKGHSNKNAKKHSREVRSMILC